VFPDYLRETDESGNAMPTELISPPTPQPSSRLAAVESLFKRVVVGVDGSEPGFEAVRQAARLVEPDGTLALVTAVHLADDRLAGRSAPRTAADLWEKAGDAVRRAGHIAGPRATSRLVNGPARSSLMRELAEHDATLTVVGTRGSRRLPQILLGSVATHLLHAAPGSVCIARPPAAEALFPRTIVAGWDGSVESEWAVAVARRLGDRFDASVQLLTASGDRSVGPGTARTLGATVVDADPVSALVDAGANADMLVVGSRGLHGLRALGSVSERVAHRARCSVLVVRPPRVTG
jgi:nucleotide-binding universal stress UspA family protein